jgi:hypothetical protein
MKRSTLLGLGCLIAFFTGCAHVYHVGIDSINDGQELANKTYVLVPGNSELEAGDLQFREFATYLGRALKMNGYTAAGVNQTPEIEIYLSYGLGSPQPRVRTYAVPVWGQTGVDITTVEKTIETRSGASKTISRTNITPEYGVTGYTLQEKTYTTYPKYVEIDAYKIKNAKPGDKLEELWKTTIHSEGKRNELRHVFPILIAAAAKYLGGNTGQEIEISLTADQAEVKMIKGSKE